MTVVTRMKTDVSNMKLDLHRESHTTETRSRHGLQDYSQTKYLEDSFLKFPLPRKQSHHSFSQWLSSLLSFFLTMFVQPRLLHCRMRNYVTIVIIMGPPLWSSGQSFWLQIQRSRVRFPVLPDFLRSRGSGMGSTQPREDNWRAIWMKK
jgi:hypothetical protein